MLRRARGDPLGCDQQDCLEIRQEQKKTGAVEFNYSPSGRLSAVEGNAGRWPTGLGAKSLIRLRLDVTAAGPRCALSLALTHTQAHRHRAGLPSASVVNT